MSVTDSGSPAPTDYDALWKNAWGELQRSGPVHRHTTLQIVQLVKTLGVKTILDVGCGAGDNLAALAASASYQLTGSDLSAAALELGRTRVPSARLVQLDIESAALPETFDLVMSVQVVEHLVDDLAALKNMARMSSRYLLVSTMAGRMRPSERAIGHIRNYSHIELETKLLRAGLEVVQLSGWGFPFYSPLYRTAIEWLPSGPPTQPTGRIARLLASALYQLYRLNLPGRGDVVMALARKAGSGGR